MNTMALVPFATAAILGLSAPTDRAEEPPRYANVHLSAWTVNITTLVKQPFPGSPVDSPPGEPRQMIVEGKENLIHDWTSFDLRSKRARHRIFEHGNLRFRVSVDRNHRLTIEVRDRQSDRFFYRHENPSSSRFIFFGLDSRPYLIEVIFTLDDHKIGMISPGILKE